MRLLVLACLLGCVHLPVQTADEAIAVAKQSRPLFMPAAENDCLWTAKKDDEFWVVRLRWNPQSTAIGKATCAICGTPRRPCSPGLAAGRAQNGTTRCQS